MIGQYLSNTNEIDTIHILPKILKLNKAINVVRFDVTENMKKFIKYFGKALFSFQKNLQNFSDSPSHRIFRRMHGVLNIDKNKN